MGDTLGRDVVLQSGLAKLHKASRVYYWQCVNQRGGWKDSSVRRGVSGPDTGLGGCSVEALPDAVKMFCISPAGGSGVGGSVSGAAMAGLATWMALFSCASAAESFQTAVEAVAGCFSQALLPPST